MFDTTFGFNSDFNQYELKVDHSKFDVTVAWLEKFGVRFNLTSFSRYILIEVIKASDAVIDALYSKFSSTEWEDYGFDQPVDCNYDEFCAEIRGQLRDILTTGRVEDLESVARQVYSLEEVFNGLTSEQEESVETYEQFLEFVIDHLTIAALAGVDAWSFVDSIQSIIWESSDRNESEVDFEAFLRSLKPVTPFSNFSTIVEVKAEYRKLGKTMHPDAGGDAEAFALLNSQYNDALDALRESVIA